MTNESTAQSGLKAFGIIILFLFWGVAILIGNLCPGLAAHWIGPPAGLLVPPVLTIIIVAFLSRWVDKRAENRS